MTPHGRVVLLTALAAAVAASGAVAVGALQGDRPGSLEQATPARPTGPPPLTFDLGVRRDHEAVLLRNGLRLYREGRRTAAAALFARGGSLEARVGDAFSRWPEGTLDRLGRLAALHPRSGLVQLHLGIAETWAGVSGAEDAWRAAAAAQPDSAYAIAAGNLLHREFAAGIPIFVGSVDLPAGFDRLSPPEQLARLELDARSSVAGKLLLGTALQRLSRPVSAERVFRAAAREAPGDAEAQVAAAVGAFDKAQPAAAFSRLGPLTRRFPQRATVRFHLGLLLLWSGEVTEAKRQLGLAVEAEPGSVPAREASKYLAELRARGI